LFVHTVEQTQHWNRDEAAADAEQSAQETDPGTQREIEGELREQLNQRRRYA
jgi:hypothetical protein